LSSRRRDSTALSIFSSASRRISSGSVLMGSSVEV
jgi:hypothetical protein